MPVWLPPNSHEVGGTKINLIVPMLVREYMQMPISLFFILLVDCYSRLGSYSCHHDIYK